jgi:hypothetical protein
MSFWARATGLIEVIPGLAPFSQAVSKLLFEIHPLLIQRSICVRTLGFPNKGVGLNTPAEITKINPVQLYILHTNAGVLRRSRTAVSQIYSEVTAVSIRRVGRSQWRHRLAGERQNHRFPEAPRVHTAKHQGALEICMDVSA